MLEIPNLNERHCKSQFSFANPMFGSKINSQNALAQPGFFDIYQGKLALEAFAYGWVCPGMPSHAQNCLA